MNFLNNSLILSVQIILFAIYFSLLTFILSCKKEVVKPPVIPPVVINTDSVNVHLISGGKCDKENETSIQINSKTKLYLYSIDTTFKAKKGDTITLASWKASFADCTSENWVMINEIVDSSETIINGSSEIYYSARLEYIIK